MGKQDEDWKNLRKAWNKAKEVEVEELPSKPPTSANTPVQNRLKSEIADLTLKIKKLQDFVSTGFAKDDQKHELHQDRL
ncbi:hypothetical protein ILUMI_15210, partial [Ignelater luminosus]